MNASGYCRTIIETEETFSSDNLRMIVLWSDNKQVPTMCYWFYAKAVVSCLCSLMHCIAAFYECD